MKQKALKILFILLSSLMGLLFIYSGYTKLNPIEPFEYTFVDLGVSNWALAPFIARFMIGLEFFIGLMLFFNLYLRSFTIKLTIGTLVFFSLYLLVMIVVNGNNGNCGCFGEALVMSPLQALLKNVIMLVIAFVIYKFHAGFSFGKLTYWTSISFLFTALTMPHILNYVDLSYSEAYLNKPNEKFAIPMDTLYSHAEINTPPKTLSQGKHVIAFLSLTCQHCRIAAKKLRIMKEKNPALDIYFVLNGDDNHLNLFHKDTKSENIPFCRLHGRAFVYLAGTNLPAIYLINNSEVEHQLNYLQLDQAEVEKWMTED